MDDRILVETAVFSTIIFAVFSFCLRRNSFFVNLAFFLVILSSFACFAWRISESVWDLGLILFARVIDGTDKRACLLLFWLICVVSSILFCIIVNLSGNCSTIHRKFFHLTVTLIGLTGIRYDFEFAWLSAWLSICIFIIIEIFRSLKIKPWSAPLNSSFLIFIDQQDSSKFILTPIFLICGIFLPLLLSPISNNERSQLYHYSGIVSVGVGDSLAAIWGSLFGRHLWSNSRKSIEGSVAFVVSQFIASFVIYFAWISSNFNYFKLIRLFFASCVCSFAEAHLYYGDNLILPLIAYFLLF